MSSDSEEDPETFEKFKADQRKKVNARYITEEEFRKIEEVDEFIVDSDSSIDEETEVSNEDASDEEVNDVRLSENEGSDDDTSDGEVNDKEVSESEGSAEDTSDQELSNKKVCNKRTAGTKEINKSLRNKNKDNELRQDRNNVNKEELTKIPIIQKKKRISLFSDSSDSESDKPDLKRKPFSHGNEIKLEKFDNFDYKCNKVSNKIKKDIKSPVKSLKLLKKSLSPLFSDCSISEPSILSDFDDKFVTPKRLPSEFSLKTVTGRNNDKSKLSKGSTVTPFKKLQNNNNIPKKFKNENNLITKIKENNIGSLTPAFKLPNKKPQTVPSKVWKKLIPIKSDKNNSDSDNSFIEENSDYEGNESLSESDIENNAIFSDSDESPLKLKKVLCTPTITSKKSLSKLTKTLPPKPISNRLDFISSLMDDVDDNMRDLEAIRYRNGFKKLKKDLALKIYHLYNEHAFLNKLPHDIDIQWSVNLLRTAGRCCCKKKSGEHFIVIELSIKVLTDAQRLLQTLMHEMCHGAVWMINKISDHHGPVWKLWAGEAHRAFPKVPRTSRCHNYEIHSKYEYWCLTCNKAIKRHSKSIDMTRKVCGRCKGKFTLYVNQANGEKKLYEENKTLTGYQKFVKDNYKKYRSTGMGHGEVMKTLSAKYGSIKEESDLSNALTSLNIT